MQVFQLNYRRLFSIWLNYYILMNNWWFRNIIKINILFDYNIKNTINYIGIVFIDYLNLLTTRQNIFLFDIKLLSIIIILSRYIKCNNTVTANSNYDYSVSKPKYLKINIFDWHTTNLKKENQN